MSAKALLVFNSFYVIVFGIFGAVEIRILTVERMTGKQARRNATRFVLPLLGIMWVVVFVCFALFGSTPFALSGQLKNQTVAYFPSGRITDRDALSPKPHPKPKTVNWHVRRFRTWRVELRRSAACS